MFTLKENLGPALEVVRHHHEKLDDSGYPDGLSTDRPYRKGLSKKKALETIHQEADEGKLDKKVVEYLIKIVGQ